MTAWGPYEYLTRTPSEYVEESRNRGGRGPVGAGPATGARPGKRNDDGAGDVPWLWIGAGVLAVILLARR